MRLAPKLLGTIFASACVLALVVYFLHSRKKVEVGPDATAPNGPKVLWQVSAGSRLLTSPALGPDGTIYFGSADGLNAVSANGKVLWKHPVPGGIHAPPVVATDGIVYFSTWLGDVQSVNPDGSTRWDPRYGSVGYSSPPALGYDGVLYLANTVS